MQSEVWEELQQQKKQISRIYFKYLVGSQFQSLEQEYFDLALFTSPITTPQVPVRISPQKLHTNLLQMETNGHNLNYLPNPEYSHQSQQKVQSLLDLTLNNSVAHQTDLSSSIQANQSTQILSALIYDPPRLLKVDLNSMRKINYIRTIDHRAQQIKWHLPGRTTSHLNKRIKKLQKQKDQKSDPMSHHIKQQISQRTHNTIKYQQQNLIAASLISNQIPQQVLEKQRQIMESHIMAMQILICTEEILQQITVSLPSLQEANISPTLLHPHLQDIPMEED
ncbi:MAG: hypothetical protein EZS28_033896 [Streblomastix strix]|uniref:Uncharacterized protein n=1 Tax=Streblomastix strix TaxID=222440 RepID=A0A5J4UID3_9EUKA|nr:MAG: hypothetical protein EZS28_033896 [Streblomastix strix]